MTLSHLRPRAPAHAGGRGRSFLSRRAPSQTYLSCLRPLFVL